MIAGEELWLDQSLYTEQEYDEFFKKIRKKLKKKVNKIIPPKIFRPFGGITTLGSRNLFGKKRPKPRPKAPFAPQALRTTQFNKAKEVQLAADRRDLTAEVAAFEEKKQAELTEIEEQKTAVEQAQIETKQGENQQLMIYGGLGVLSVIVILALVARQSSKQSQLEALAALAPVKS